MNKTGSTAAFEVSAHFEYAEMGDGVPIQSQTTEPVANGQAAEFSISPDPTSSTTPQSCEVLAVERASPGGAPAP